MVVASSSPEFGSEIQKLADSVNAAIAFPTSDAALHALSPSSDMLMNKRSLDVAAAAVGLATPSTQAFSSHEDLRRLASEIAFPIIVKPESKRPGEPPAQRVLAESDIEDVEIESGIIQPFVNGPTQAMAGFMHQGRTIATVQQRYIRTYPPSAGTASYAVTEDVDQERLERLAALLGNTDGIFQAQFVGGMLIDLNLRAYGSMPLALAAGVNLPDLALRVAAGDQPPFQTARTGVRYRWIDGDIRSTFHSLDGGFSTKATALAQLLPRPNTCHSIASMGDPAPMLLRLNRTGRRS